MWLTPEGELWVERSVASDAAVVFDVFDARGRRARQVTLPAGRRVVGMGRAVVYAVAKDPNDLEALEQYARRSPTP